MAAVHRTPWDGIIVGLIAYTAVAAFYMGFDVLAARGPLYTVDVLGRALFQGFRDPTVLQYPIQPDLNAMFWYNGFHFLIALAIGSVVTALVDRAERRPDLAVRVMSLIVAGFVVTILGVGFLTQPIRPVLPWWSIVVANALATVVAALYLVRRRPGLGRRMLGLAA